MISSRLHLYPSVLSVVQNKGFRIGPQISLIPQIKHDQFETASVPICAIRGSKQGIQNWTTDFTDITVKQGQFETVSVPICAIRGSKQGIQNWTTDFTDTTDQA
jgi:hypothetical protein